MAHVEIGARAEVRRVVTVPDLATAWGADFPPAASTPFVLGLAEVACHSAVRKELAEGEITVGTGATIRHLAPSREGARLKARATLTGREGRRYRFRVEVFDGGAVVADVEHERARVRSADIITRLEPEA